MHPVNELALFMTKKSEVLAIKSWFITLEF